MSNISRYHRTNVDIKTQNKIHKKKILLAKYSKLNVQQCVKVAFSPLVASPRKPIFSFLISNIEIIM